VASGWHTGRHDDAACSSRSDITPVGGSDRRGRLRSLWPRPTRPATCCSAESEVLEMRPSKSRPEIGIMKVKLTTYNQKNEVVQIAHPTMIVPRRPPK
jgi:hypothetical protein